MGRKIDLNRGTTEVELLKKYAQGSYKLNTKVSIVDRNISQERMENPQSFKNPVPEMAIGYFRKATASKNLTVDRDLIDKLSNNHIPIPFFLEAGPRQSLTFNPSSVKVAIITSGGIAPGLHSVIHAIVKRHREIYKMNHDQGGRLFGIRDGFLGLCQHGQEFIELKTDQTVKWLSLGGSELGSVRYFGVEKLDRDIMRREIAEVVAKRLKDEDIDILYILGGDGSIHVAHEIAGLVKDKSIACVPKTMDNDILWVWQSFGFSTAVQEATRFINTLHREAVSTRRIGLIELFGAESGFVAANAALASGHVDLVLIPEVFNAFFQDKNNGNIDYEVDACKQYLIDSMNHIKKRIKDRRADHHAIIVLAEGVSNYLREGGFVLDDEFDFKKGVIHGLQEYLRSICKNNFGRALEVFDNQPRHNIRAVAANSHDQIYCERLGALVVDNALAGYTDFMVSQWMTEYVLVPLELATVGQKMIPLDGVFWKQVMNITGQPTHEIYIRKQNETDSVIA